jgi:hypothetical protein
LDSGATGKLGNFIDRRFAELLGLPVSSTGPAVHGFGDHKVQSAGTVRVKVFLPSVLDGRCFRQTLTLTVVDLYRHDLVLGMPFLQQHNPRIDWQDQTVDLSCRGSAYRFVGVPPGSAATAPRASIEIMSVGEFDRCCDEPDTAEVFLMLIRPAEKRDDLSQRVGKEVSVSELPDDIPDEVKQLILRYSKAFPPKTIGQMVGGHGFCHTIPLVDGAERNPPNRYSFRLAPAEMEELKSQIGELLPANPLLPLVHLFCLLERKMAVYVCVLIIAR